MKKIKKNKQAEVVGNKMKITKKAEKCVSVLVQMPDIQTIQNEKVFNSFKKGNKRRPKNNK